MVCRKHNWTGGTRHKPCPECQQEGAARSYTLAEENERLRKAHAAIVDLSAGWDEDGSTGPRDPLSWETVGRLAMDYSRAALKPQNNGDDDIDEMCNKGMDQLSRNADKLVAAMETPNVQDNRPEAVLSPKGPC